MTVEASEVVDETRGGRRGIGDVAASETSGIEVIGDSTIQPGLSTVGEGALTVVPLSEKRSGILSIKSASVHGKSEMISTKASAPNRKKREGRNLPAFDLLRARIDVCACVSRWILAP